jgi:hypothetical protein
LIKLHNNMSTCEVQVLAQKILGTEIWDLKPKQWHKMKKFKRHFLDYEISDFCMLV